MLRTGSPALGPFALYVLPDSWLGEAPKPGSPNDIVWVANGPHAVPLEARRDGFIVFEFDQSERYAGGSVPEYELESGNRVPQAITKLNDDRIGLGYRRFSYMNAFLQAFASSMASWQGHGIGTQAPVDPVSHFKAARASHGWRIYQPLGTAFRAPDSRGVIVQLATLDHTLDLMNESVRVFGDEFVEVMSLTYIACYHYSKHQFSSAHLISWSVAEKLINHMWSNLLAEIDKEHGGHTRVTKRRKELLNGRDYTASVICQILSINGKLEDDVLDRLNLARKRRNDFAHGLAPIDADDAATAIRLSTDLLAKLTGVPVAPQLSTSFWL